MKNQILLVEDSKSIVDTLLPNLSRNQFDVTHSGSIQEAKKALLGSNFSLAILDINLPDGNGLDLCQEIHEAYPELPIIMLTARTEEETAVDGFTRGAIDFVRKPFGLNEFIVRVKRLLNRDVQKPRNVSFGALTVDLTSGNAFCGSQQLELSRREFDLLVLLVKRAGEVVERDEILSCFEDDGELLDRTIDSHVSRLRRKLKQGGGDKVKIRSVYGQGYRLEES